MAKQHLPNSRPAATGPKQTSRKRSLSCVMGPPLALQPADSGHQEPADSRAWLLVVDDMARGANRPQLVLMTSPNRHLRGQDQLRKAEAPPSPLAERGSVRQGKISDAEVREESAPSGKQGKRRAAKTAAEVGPLASHASLAWLALHSLKPCDQPCEGAQLAL